MARRFQRVYARFPIDLVSADEKVKFEEAGSVVDVGQRGLRVQTGPRLIPGQVLHLFHEGQGRPFAPCRVVWAQTHGSALPSQASLEILERHPMLPAAARLLSPRTGASL